MKKILLIPSYYYLSNPIYIAMKELLDEDFEFIYFFTKDSTCIKLNLENISYELVGKKFDKYVEIDFDPFWVTKLSVNNNLSNLGLINLILRLKNNILYFFNIRKYIKHFVEKINRISPDYIVLTSDMTFSYRIIKRYFPTIKIIIIQPCFLDFRDKKLKKFSILEKIGNILLGNLYYPKQSYFGLESKNDKLLLFDDKFMDFYKNKRENIYKIINPFFSKLNQEIASLNKNNIKKLLFKSISINPSKPIIILFASDYTTIHGNEVQMYIENTYINLIKKYYQSFNFIIKNHPRAGIKNFDVHFKGYKEVFFLQNELSYNELLAIGNLNISINSNASLESIICGMPTINFLPLDLQNNEHFKWLSYYGATEANTFKDIDILLRKFNKDMNYFNEKVESGRRKLVDNQTKCKEKLLKAFSNED